MFSEVVPPTSASASVPANASGTISLRSRLTASIALVDAGSPVTGTERSATSPLAERSISPSPKRLSPERRARSPSSAVATPSPDAFDTTISAGSGVVPGKSRSSATKPCFETKRSGSVETPPVPTSNLNTGRASATSSPAESARLSPGRRRTPRTIEPEQRRQERECREHRGNPDEDRTGREATHDRARDEQHPKHRDHEGRAAEEHRPAGGRARRLDRAELFTSLPSLFAVARDDEEGIVDPERKAHPREHVDDEDRELELLSEQRGESERDHDRDH